MNKVKCLNPWDCPSKKLYDANGTYGTLTAMNNGGGRADGICYCNEKKEEMIHCFSIGSMNSKGMLSSNPQAGIYETTVARTLDTTGPNPAGYQGGNVICIALEENGARPSHFRKGFCDDGTMYTLNTIEQHSVCYAIDCRNLYLNSEKSGTLQAKNEGGHSLNFINPILKVNDV